MTAAHTEAVLHDGGLDGRGDLPTSLRYLQRPTSSREKAWACMRISEWANAIPGHPHRDLGHKIQVEEGRVLTVVDIAFDATCDSREIVRKHWLMKQGEAHGAAQVAYDTLDVWAVNFPRDEWRAKGKVEADIAHSGEVVTCPVCTGVGRSVCPNCGGRGMTKCPECGGDGLLLCAICRGSGTVGESQYCGNCGGKGAVGCPRCREVVSDTAGRPAVVIGQSRPVACRDCQGTGRLLCPQCGGLGSALMTLAVLSTKHDFGKMASLKPEGLPRYQHGPPKATRLLRLAQPEIRHSDLDGMDPALQSCISSMIEESRQTPGVQSRPVWQHVDITGYAILSLDFSFEGKSYRFWFLKDGPLLMDRSPLASKGDLDSMLAEANGVVKEQVILACTIAGVPCALGIPLCWLLWGPMGGLGFGLVGTAAALTVAWQLALARATGLIRGRPCQEIKILARKAGMSMTTLHTFINGRHKLLAKVWPRLVGKG